MMFLIASTGIVWVGVVRARSFGRRCCSVASASLAFRRSRLRRTWRSTEDEAMREDSRCYFHRRHEPSAFAICGATESVTVLACQPCLQTPIGYPFSPERPRFQRAYLPLSGLCRCVAILAQA
eukprot:6598789-Pyramimonas_sp.AAC.1